MAKQNLLRRWCVNHGTSEWLISLWTIAAQQPEPMRLLISLIEYLNNSPWLVWINLHAAPYRLWSSRLILTEVQPAQVHSVPLPSILLPVKQAINLTFFLCLHCCGRTWKAIMMGKFSSVVPRFTFQISCWLCLDSGKRERIFFSWEFSRFCLLAI